MIQPLVADLSHHNWDQGAVPDFNLARASGTIGVIYKASEGSTYQDPTYKKSRTLAKNAGMLWGAYHFGTAANVKGQVENYLKATDPDDQTLVCLDFELNEANPRNSITKDIAFEFLYQITQRLGRIPKIYTGPYMYDLFGRDIVSEFQVYDVWWARYAELPEVHPTWTNYWLWQYTDGHNGPKPHQVAGFDFCDYSHFIGSVEQLRDSWTK